MSAYTVVGFSGNFTRPSKTRGFVDHVVREAAASLGYFPSVFDIQDLGPSFPGAKSPRDLDSQAGAIIDKVVSADLLVIGTPTYKGSYTGLFKHFFDLLDPSALKRKPVVLLATGGGERHSLIVEHQLRPLFGFFEALALPTAVYASDRDFSEGVLVSETIQARASQAVAEAGYALSGRAQPRIAAE
ncbi:FMN reductase [Aquamicrobium sp. LC103]|uniref:FMN reductase n=1 Tax=Aquamicrobium sp. LC103 TaxID=1120658 RepID=UPI00063E8950|nr:FMN reductase [Aquamicrobium sp. LC103]TKT76160.1 FMN reductase [Aquamicrobium sp. LC103]